MSVNIPQCQNLDQQVNSVIKLLLQESSLRSQDLSAVRTSLEKAISPRFEIVFAGAFSAGKSMLINALLGRELLYSAQGHATGTICYIEYAATPSDEKVVLTFLSEVEIREQVHELCQTLGLSTPGNLHEIEEAKGLQEAAKTLYEQEGGESRNQRAKRAKALEQLLAGFVANRDKINAHNNTILSMGEIADNGVDSASLYARRSQNSAVIKKIEYYCHHPLLEDGNVIIDTPGIDAPVQRDTQIAYDKIEHSDTSAVVCVFKTAANGELTSEETQLLERIQNNSGIRDRVFYVFNYIDATWYDDQLKNCLNRHLNTQFSSSDRVYKTSGLLGFYGELIRQTHGSDRWGLDSIFAKGNLSNPEAEETPKFIVEFNNYFFTSGQLSRSSFPITPAIGYADTHQEKYLQILNAHGYNLMEQLVLDSGIDQFRDDITRYLTEDRRPQLFQALAEDLRPVCISLRSYYLQNWWDLENQPKEIDAIKDLQLRQLSQDLKTIGDEFEQYIKAHVNHTVASNENAIYERDFRNLQRKMIERLDTLIQKFSVGEAYKRAQSNHPNSAVVPLLAILAEAFYSLSDDLKATLVESCDSLVANFFQQLTEQVHQADFYHRLYRLLGNDGGIDATLNQLHRKVHDAVISAAQTECGAYVRETPEFYAEGTVPHFQLRQTLREACNSADYQGMVEAEPAIRQLLKIDFEKKVKRTVLRHFRTVINLTINDNLQVGAKHQSKAIFSQYETARANLAKTLEQEAEEKLEHNHQLQEQIKQKIDAYNESVIGINDCLVAMGLGRGKLPAIKDTDLDPVFNYQQPAYTEPSYNIEDEQETSSEIFDAEFTPTEKNPVMSE
ncbi:dynamin-like GTPase family protein [Limnospira fusiformis KN01]|uniref:Dynamin-like GTPase family protein n=1 Tax=Limnospira fusiformis PMC 851.14 TaxID=2219512 RepID=A0ABU9EMN4_LIMFS|nr:MULTISPECIES: dynamin-like GTPase family protein [Limnospira]MDT9197935.1 dynamin-like GTPase family protein [Limnospira sp. PMC 1042.18]ULB43533.1 dynamin-like GTPase family protein [Limnospira fusiformis KN01]